MADVDQVIERIRHLIDLEGAQLSGEFFPAHLPIAVIDAVFNPRLQYEKQVVPIIERYCTWFELQRVRLDRDRMPGSLEQETLADLIRHYEDLGVERMTSEVFRARYRSPGTSILKSENVLYVAEALFRAGVNNLQDAADHDPRLVKRALLPLKGIGHRTVHMLLMYVGNDCYVKGDVHVIRFVSEAVGHEVTATESEVLLRQAAARMGVAPRFLDFKVWEHGSSAES